MAKQWVIRMLQGGVLGTMLCMGTAAYGACARDDVRCRLAEQKAQQGQKQQGQSSSAQGAHTGGATRWNKDASTESQEERARDDEAEEESDD